MRRIQIHGVFAPDINLEESRVISMISRTLHLAYISFISCDMSTAGIGIQTTEQIRMLSDLGVNMVIVGTKILERLNAGEKDMVDYIDLLHGATYARN